LADLTLEDIAKKAGVSRSTVSRVINNQPSVRDDVRKRVMGVIQSTGFHPNAAARTLVSQRSNMIGLVLPRSVSSFFADPYYPRLTQGIAQACNQYSLTLGLFLVSTREDEEKIIPRILRNGYLDGILMQSGQVDDPLIDRLIESGIPLVIAGRPPVSKCVSYIDVDNVAASFGAVSHLIRMGYQRIGMISGPADVAVGIDRRSGYLKALAERGREAIDTLVVEGDFTEVGGYYAMRELLTASPDAVFSASDIMAIGAMRAIREAGLRIPDDIAIIGFDDLPLPTHPTPQLTTVRQPIDQFGFQAVEILIDLIENGLNPPRRVIMDTELIIRDSCGASRRW
jgi:LacI family transcriptional regulator